MQNNTNKIKETISKVKEKYTEAKDIVAKFLHNVSRQFRGLLKQIYYTKQYRITSIIIVSIALITVIITTAVYNNRSKDYYDKWFAIYNTDIAVDYAKYEDAVCIIADASIGIPTSNEKVEKVRGQVSVELFDKLSKYFNTVHIGEVQETEKTVEEKMDAIVGGDTSIDYTQYTMRVVERNFYYPEMFVFKLINNSGNSVTVVVYTDENGGIKDVKTSI